MTDLKRRYKLDFEYVSPFDGKWTKASRESTNLDEIKEQYKNQLMMPDVRNSILYEQESPEWTVVKL